MVPRIHTRLVRLASLSMAGLFSLQVLTAQHLWEPAPEPPEPPLAEKAAQGPAGGPVLPTGSLTGQVTAFDGGGLPGARVTLTPPGGGPPRVATTSDEGYFRVSGLPLNAAAYTLTVELEGFETFTGEQTINREGVHRNIILSFAPIDEEIIVVDAAFDAAGNRPQWLEDSDVAPGAALNIFGDFGVDELTFNELGQDGSLDNEIFGIEVFIEQGGEQFAAPTAWIAPFQAVSIVPFDLQNGVASVYMRENGRESNHVNFNIGSSVYYFTWSADGQGTVAATHLDNTPVTFTHPAREDEIITAWNSAAPDSVFSEFDPFLYFDGQEGGLLDRETQGFYFGNSGRGFGQNNFSIPSVDEDPFGCATRAGLVEHLFGVHGRYNIVALPTSPDGEPCNDPYGFIKDMIFEFDEPGGLRTVSPTFTVSRNWIFAGDELEQGPLDRSEFRVFAADWNNFNYVPAVAPGECVSEWRPQGFAGTGTALPLTGSFRITLEGLTTVPLDQTVGYSRIFQPVPGLDQQDGQINVRMDADLNVGGDPFLETYNSALEYLGAFIGSHDIKVGEVAEDFLGNPGNPTQGHYWAPYFDDDPAGEYGRSILVSVNGGAKGSWFLTCGEDAQHPLNFDAYDREIERMGTVTLGLPEPGTPQEEVDNLFPAESIAVTLRLFQLDTNQALRGPNNIGTVDNFRHDYRFFFFPEGETE